VRLMDCGEGIHALRTLRYQIRDRATLAKAKGYWCLSFYPDRETKDTVMKLTKDNSQSMFSHPKSLYLSD
jgi:hypothetical protein